MEGGGDGFAQLVLVHPFDVDPNTRMGATGGRAPGVPCSCRGRHSEASLAPQGAKRAGLPRLSSLVAQRLTCS